jgi:hypothetical protein
MVMHAGYYKVYIITNRYNMPQSGCDMLAW